MTGQRRDPGDFLPLKHSMFRILLAIGNQEMHGYAIMQAIERKTDGREGVLPGTLYASIARMVIEGLVEERKSPDDDGSGGPRRRYYRRTQLGLAVARAESERMSALVEVARSEDLLAGT